jgi:hypothetical protein
MVNYSYIDDTLKTNKRYLSKSGKMLGTEKLMIKFFTRALASQNPNDVSLFDSLIAGLNKLSAENNNSEQSIDYYNIRAWANSKIQNKPLKQYLKENPAGIPGEI